MVAFLYLIRSGESDNATISCTHDLIKDSGELAKINGSVPIQVSQSHNIRNDTFVHLAASRLII